MLFMSLYVAVTRAVNAEWGNNIKDVFVSQGNSGSPGEGIGGFMKHNRRFNEAGNNESPRKINPY